MAGFMVHMIGDEVRPIIVCTATATTRPHSLSAWPSSLSGESQTYVIRWFQRHCANMTRLVPTVFLLPTVRRVAYRTLRAGA